MANYNPTFYEFAIAIFKHPFFGVSEIGLMAALLFHAFNGIRITILDFKPELWKYQKQSVTAVWGLFLVVFIPIGIYMFMSIVNNCNHLGAAACWAWPTYGG
jgi:succinate dehydrogenase / fumarate reductase cytochrome b subunit